MQQASQRGTVQARDISLSASWTYFAISIVINSMGNVLTLVTSTHIHPHFGVSILDRGGKQLR